MRHLLLVILVGCGGGGTSGEPIMGTVTLDYGGSKPKMVVGSAVTSIGTTTNMLVQIGSNHVDCETYLDVFLDFDVPSGSFIYFDVPMNQMGQKSILVSVMKSGSRNVAINEAPGIVTIDSIEPRVTGSVTMATTDQDVGMISVAGTFDVKRCF